MLHALGRRHLVALERLDDLDVVHRRPPLDGAQELAGRHVAVVGDVARHQDRAFARHPLPLRDELGDAGELELVVPGRAEHAEERLGLAEDVGPVLLVVDPAGLPSSFNCATCWRSALMSSPPTAAATTSGFACWILRR